MRGSAEDPINKEVRRRLRRWRLARGLTIAELAELSGLARSSYANLEYGAYRLHLGVLNQILAALGMGVTAVWPEGESPTTPALVVQRQRIVLQEVVEIVRADSGLLLWRHGMSRQLLLSVGLSRSAAQSQVHDGLSPHRARSIFQFRTLTLVLDGQIHHRAVLEAMVTCHLERWYELFRRRAHRGVARLVGGG